jgi:hypothetical protein
MNSIGLVDKLMITGIVVGGGLLVYEFGDAFGGLLGPLETVMGIYGDVLNATVEGVKDLSKLDCQPGEDKEAGLCYDMPHEGYECSATLCQKTCGADFISNGGRDDGAYCGKGNYGRGLGKRAYAAGPGREINGALQYPVCREGYEGVGPVCWQKCPQGYDSDGLLCRRNASIVSANNSDCPWYDKCGLVSAKGCSKCPEGYTNDGCTCRRDVHIFAKDSYTRGAGEVLGCGEDEEIQSGLCYKRCRTGYEGEGPVCWQKCPQGTNSIGVSCQKDSYDRGVGRVMKVIK